MPFARQEKPPRTIGFRFLRHKDRLVFGGGGGYPARMKITGSIVKAGDERFAVVMVQPGVLEFRSEADRYVEALGNALEGLPVVLLARPPSGKARYYGREDLIATLSGVDPDRIPWREMSVDL